MRQAGSKKKQYEDKHKDKYKDKYKNNRQTYDLHDIYSVYKREYKAEINSLGYDLAILRLVIQSLGRVQAPWIDHRGKHNIIFLLSKSWSRKYSL